MVSICKFWHKVKAAGLCATGNLDFTSQIDENCLSRSTHILIFICTIIFLDIFKSLILLKMYSALKSKLKYGRIEWTHLLGIGYLVTLLGLIHLIIIIMLRMCFTPIIFCSCYLDMIRKYSTLIYIHPVYIWVQWLPVSIIR